jgi:hypothetical protein
VGKAHLLFLYVMQMLATSFVYSALSLLLILCDIQCWLVHGKYGLSRFGHMLPLFDQAFRD